MPKFSISADASLDSTLKEMGITDAFGDNADFSGMSDEVKLKVSKVGKSLHMLGPEMTITHGGLFTNA